MRKDKKKRKGKKGFSTADILKLLKKLKPQTQQVVRVNVGDSDKKKKKGNVQSSYNPPFVFPTKENYAITSSGQPPDKSPSTEQSGQVITKTIQPDRTNVQLPPSQPVARREITFEAAARNPPTRPQISDISESEFSEVELQPRRGRGRPSASSAQSFAAPKGYQPSTLFQSSSQPSYFNLPVQNDRFQANIISTNAAGDQIGTLANQVPSSEWTGSPQGEITLSVEEIPGGEEGSQPVSLSDVFFEEPTYEELQQQQEEAAAAAAAAEEFQEEIPVKLLAEAKKKEPVPVQGVKAPEKEVRAKVGVKSLLAGNTNINEINRAVRENGYVILGLPSEYIASRGATKGQIKEASRRKITVDEIDPIYEDMLIFTGRKAKKAPFVVKKTEE